MNKNTQSFVQKADEKHKGLYDYTSTVFSSSRPITVVCKEHGKFAIRAKDHLKGIGCPVCIERNKYILTEEFISKASKLYNNRYDYTGVLITYIDQRIVIHCNKHAPFYTTMDRHLAGEECTQCVAEDERLVRLINKSKDTHGVKYDYSDVYLEDGKLMSIICHKHGKFNQCASDHTSGHGCLRCSSHGFNHNKPGKLYYLKINNGEFYKIGITNRTVELRFTLDDLKVIEVLFTIDFKHGGDAYNEEQHILKEFNEFRAINVNILSSGNTELFTTDVLSNTQYAKLYKN